MNSSRFPGKPLKKILGREMVLRVCDIAIESQLIDQVVVATEDVEIQITRIPEVVCSNLVGMAGIYVYDHLSITNFPAMDLGLVEAWKGLDTFGFIGRVPVVPFKLPYRTHGVDRPSDIALVEEKL
jgi:CMP-2-keto-3-deoxyoctulosonic acid synthetase